MKDWCWNCKINRNKKVYWKGNSKSPKIIKGKFKWNLRNKELWRIKMSHFWISKRKKNNLEFREMINRRNSSRLKSKSKNYFSNSRRSKPDGNFIFIQELLKIKIHWEKLGLERASQQVWKRNWKTSKRQWKTKNWKEMQPIDPGKSILSGQKPQSNNDPPRREPKCPEHKQHY